MTENATIEKILKEKGWHTLNIYLEVSPETGAVTVALSGLRSDGEWIYSGKQPVEALGKGDDWMWGAVIFPKLRDALQRAMNNFESFRNCDCKIGFRCGKHQKEIGDANQENRGSGEREAALPGSGAQSPDTHGL